MFIKYRDISEKGKLRESIIKNILPKKSLVDSMLMPKIDVLKPLLLRMLYAELEIYRAYPKKPLEESGNAKVALKTFDARNHTTCFQGKAFDVKDHTWGDADLRDYRRAIGTFNHAEWGDATLMEIWGGDHMKDYSEMVKQAFKYGANLINKRPVLKFHVNPIFMSVKSGKTKLTKEQKIHKYDNDLLLAKSMVWGARTEAEARKAENSRRLRSDKQQEKVDREYYELRKSMIGI
tara:strand:- start:9986 stop:10690 length:705 start_codon:yes stop_codon:yes gene_type:complete